MNTVPRTGEDVSPTPPLVYEPRLWRVRIFTPENPAVGTSAMFKAPYGVYMNALQVLGRAMARGQITRIEYGPISKRQIKLLTRENPRWRDGLERYEVVFERLGTELGIDWGA